MQKNGAENENREPPQACIPSKARPPVAFPVEGMLNS